MNRATTSILEPHKDQKHYPTPNKSKVQGAVEFCEAMRIPYHKEDVFRVFGVERHRGYEFLSEVAPRRLNNNPDVPETQGRKKIISPREIREMERILEPIVKQWLLAKQDFVLEEDRDASHGTGKSNIVRTWKKNNGLEYFFNCAGSPDLSPIENCWQAPKQMLKKYPHWDDATTKGLVYEGWEHVTQEFINERVSTMPQRLKDVIESDGRMTGY